MLGGKGPGGLKINFGKVLKDGMESSKKDAMLVGVAAGGEEASESGSSAARASTDGRN